ncbi:MAG: RNA polymerase factor sigma-32 [Nitrospiria bacterium]
MDSDIVDIEKEAPDPESPPEIDTRAVSIYDPLHRYLAEIRRYPFLTKEEELHLARRFREREDLDAVTQLILSHLRLAASIAMEYKRLPFNVMDLIQEGNVGLMHGVKKYDPSKGVRVATYAAWWIRAYILKHILQNWRLVRIGTTEVQRKLFFRLSKEREALEKRGVTVTPKLLADQLDVKEKEVVEMTQRLSDRELSFDEPIGPDSDTSVGSMLSSGQEAVDENLGKKQLKKVFQEKLMDFSKTLNPREADILRARILSEKPKTLEDFALKYEISKERIRQVEANLLKKLKKFMKEKITDFEDISQV